jgi:hypothetical protein
MQQEIVMISGLPPATRPAVGTEKRYDVEGVTCELDGRTLRVVNMSLGGFFAAGDLLPPAGEVVEIRLNLPGGVSVAGRGRVAWINAVDNRLHQRLPPGCGIQTQRLSFSDKMAIAAALRRFSLPLARAAGAAQH